MVLLRSYLFAPGNNEKILRKVFGAGADAVVLDLEDAVPLSEKARARVVVATTLESASWEQGTPVWVRINAIGSSLWKDDLVAVAVPGLDGIRIPKADSVEEMRRADEALTEIEIKKGLPAGGIRFVCTVENAKGIWAARDLAGCPRVTNLTFGAADFAQDAGLDPGEDELETIFARSHLVMASREAGIDPPVASVYTRLTDDEGLRRSTEANRRLGFFGRSVIHPRQIPIVHEVFTPGPEALAHARRIVETFEMAAARGKGTSMTEDGQFVDLAVVRRARALLALAGHQKQEGGKGEIQ